MINFNEFFPGDAEEQQTAALVNGEEITMEELNNQFKSLPPAYQQFMTKEDLLEQMINERLLLQKSDELGFSVSDEEVETAIDAAIAQSSISKTEFEARLAEQNLSMDDVQGFYRNQLVITKMINDTVLANVDVTDEEIEQYYDLNKAAYEIGEQVSASHILVNTSEEAEDIIALYVDGQDFAELAKEYSIGPSGPTGGELGFFEKGVMVPEFEKAAFALEVGDVSEPVQTNFGWHIIWLQDRMEAGTQSLEDVRDSIETSLYAEKQQDAFLSFMTELRLTADVTNYLTEERMQEMADDVGVEPEVLSESSKCVQQLGLGAHDTIFYYHADAELCPVCNQMQTTVMEVISAGYPVHYAEAGEKLGVDVIDECFPDIKEDGRIPKFVCSSTRAVLVGSKTTQQLTDFASTC